MVLYSTLEVVCVDVIYNNGEYIDVDGALKRVGGNMDLYKRLLKRFVEGNNLGPLKGAIVNGNPEEAARHAHTVKGVSSNLSLIKIADLSANLEQLIKNGEDHSACLAELEQAYDTTVAIIAGITG